MKKLFGSLIAMAALASPAYAGIGTTAYLSSTSDGTAWVPSLDVRTDGWLVQIHVLDTIGSLPNKYINFGTDVTKIAVKKKVGEEVEGIIAPGLGLRLNADTGFDSVGFNAVAQMRMGAEMKQGIGFGMYVVPMLGIGNIPTAAATKSTIGVVYGGGLQVSVWTKK